MVLILPWRPDIPPAADALNPTGVKQKYKSVPTFEVDPRAIATQGSRSQDLNIRKAPHEERSELLERATGLEPASVSLGS